METFHRIPNSKQMLSQTSGSVKSSTQSMASHTSIRTTRSVVLDKLVWPGAKTIKKITNSTPNKSQTHRAKQYEVTSFLSTDCELSTDPCSKNVYSLGPRSSKTSRHLDKGVSPLAKPKVHWYTTTLMGHFTPELCRFVHIQIDIAGHLNKLNQSIHRRSSSTLTYLLLRIHSSRQIHHLARSHSTSLCTSIGMRKGPGVSLGCLPRCSERMTSNRGMQFTLQL